MLFLLTETRIFQPFHTVFIDHIHTKNGNPVPVKKELQKIIKKNVKALLSLNNRGIKVTFTDISRLRTLMQEQLLKKDSESEEKSANNSDSGEN